MIAQKCQHINKNAFEMSIKIIKGGGGDVKVQNETCKQLNSAEFYASCKKIEVQISIVFKNEYLKTESWENWASNLGSQSTILKKLIQSISIF